MIRKLLAFTLLTTALSAQVDESGENTVSFSLEEAQAYALKHAYDVENKQIELEKSRETIRETASRGLPQISSSFEFNYNAQIAQQPVPAEFFGGEPGTFQTVAFGTKYQNVASLSLNQLILDGSYFVALQASKVYKEGARLDKVRSELQIKRDVSQAYYGVLISRETVRVIKQNLATLQENFEETRALYEEGFVEEQDVDQLELLISNLNNNLNRSERQSEIAMMTLNYNLGRPVRNEILLTDGIDDVLINEDILASTSFDIESNVNYKYVEIQEKGAGLNVKNENWQNYPTLSGFIRHGQSNFTNEFDQLWTTSEDNWIPSTVFGVSFKWDLFQGLRRSATVQKAKLDRDKAEVAVDQTESQLKLQFERAKSTYEYTFDTYISEKKNVALSKKIRDRTLIKYKEGLVSSLELTQAENQYLESQQNMLNALQNLLNAKEELILAIGKQSN